MVSFATAAVVRTQMEDSGAIVREPSLIMRVLFPFEGLLLGELIAAGIKTMASKLMKKAE